MCGKMLYTGGLTWHDLAYETTASLHSTIQRAHVQAPVYVYVPVSNVGVYVSDLKDSVEQSDDFSCPHAGNEG